MRERNQIYLQGLKLVQRNEDLWVGFKKVYDVVEAGLLAFKRNFSPFLEFSWYI